MTIEEIPSSHRDTRRGISDALLEADFGECHVKGHSIAMTKLRSANRNIDGPRHFP